MFVFNTTRHMNVSRQFTSMWEYWLSRIEINSVDASRLYKMCSRSPSYCTLPYNRLTSKMYKPVEMIMTVLYLSKIKIQLATCPFIHSLRKITHLSQQWVITLFTSQTWSVWSLIWVAFLLVLPHALPQLILPAMYVRIFELLLHGHDVIRIWHASTQPFLNLFHHNSSI